MKKQKGWANRVSIYPNVKYRNLLIGLALDSHESVSSTGNDIIKKFLDGLPEAYKVKLLDLAKRKNDFV